MGYGPAGGLHGVPSFLARPGARLRARTIRLPARGGAGFARRADGYAPTAGPAPGPRRPRPAPLVRTVGQGRTWRASRPSAEVVGGRIRPEPCARPGAPPGPPPAPRALSLPGALGCARARLTPAGGGGAPPGPVAGAAGPPGRGAGPTPAAFHLVPAASRPAGGPRVDPWWPCLRWSWWRTSTAAGGGGAPEVGPPARGWTRWPSTGPRPGGATPTRAARAERERGPRGSRPGAAPLVLQAPRRSRPRWRPSGGSRSRWRRRRTSAAEVVEVRPRPRGWPRWCSAWLTSPEALDGAGRAGGGRAPPPGPHATRALTRTGAAPSCSTVHGSRGNARRRPHFAPNGRSGG